MSRHLPCLSAHRLVKWINFVLDVVCVLCLLLLDHWNRLNCCDKCCWYETTSRNATCKTKELYILWSQRTIHFSNVLFVWVCFSFLFLFLVHFCSENEPSGLKSVSLSSFTWYQADYWSLLRLTDWVGDGMVEELIKTLF